MSAPSAIDHAGIETLLGKRIAPRLTRPFAEPQGGPPLVWTEGGLLTSQGRHYPVVGGIPRFVESDNYVASFSFEWNTHNQTQIDWVTGGGSSEAFFREKTGLTPMDLRGKLVLDAGVGAGRFADVMSRWGADVVGVDLSFAVEASYANFHNRPNVMIAQADIGKLPFRPGTFDLIVSIGVLHHTPDTETYFKALVPLLRPGGRICIWLYPDEGDYRTRAAWIPYVNKVPPGMFYDWCRWFVPWALGDRSKQLPKLLRRVFPYSDQGLGMANDVLDTFDGYSPRYHGIHSPEEAVAWFEEMGLVDIQALPYRTSVIGRRPDDAAPHAGGQ